MKEGPLVRPRDGAWRRVALACSSLLSPASLMAAALAAWQLAVTLDWADGFAGSSSRLLSWQYLAAVAALLQLLAVALDNLCRGQLLDQPAPETYLRQNDGVNTTNAVKNSSRPQTMQKARTHLTSGLK